MARKPKLAGWLTVAEAAQLIGVTEDHVGYLVRRGVLRDWRLSHGFRMIHAADAKQYAENPAPTGRPRSRVS